MLYDQLIESHVGGGRIALTIGGGNYSYDDLDRDSKKILSSLRGLGIQCGDRVLISCENDLETVLLMLACIAGGIVIIPVDRNVDLSRYRSIVENCEPRLVFCVHDDIEKWHYGSVQLLDKTSAVHEWTVSEGNSHGDGGSSRSSRCRIDRSCMGYIIYTSGSEGYPRGVAARYRQILFCIDKINEMLRHTAADRILSSLPVSFDYGLYQIFLAFSAGAHLFLIRGRQFQKIPGMLAEHRITGWPGMPFLFELLLKTKMLERVHTPDLRYITSTGDVFPVSLIKRMEEVFPRAFIIPMYGLTECKRVSIMPMDREILSRKIGSCGIPLPGTKVYLRDKEAITGIGELVICGPNVMDGYWNAKDETDRYFVLNDNGDNILYSGDLFWIDEDGYLFFKGRKKRILKINGYRISCAEVENFVGSIGGVAESCAFDYQGSTGEERICICVVSAVHGIEKEVRRRLACHSPAIRDIDIRVYRDFLPRNTNGKIDAERLKKENRCHDL